MDDNEVTASWDRMLAVEDQFWQGMMSSWLKMPDKETAMAFALGSARLRGTALRWLLLLLDDELKFRLFPKLIDLASVGHCDIALCRAVIRSMPRDWVLDNVDAAIQGVLRISGGDEEYRRFAELLYELDRHSLYKLVESALHHTDEHVREVGSDYQRFCV